MSATTNCQAPTLGISLAEGTFQGCYVLREVAAPGCVQYGPRVFAECCSLGRVGASHETEDSNDLAPGAQLGKYAFESCLTLTTITFDMDHTNKPRALPEGAFCCAGIESSAYRVTSTISGRGIKPCGGQPHGHRDHSPPLFHICPLCSLKLLIAPATTHANWQRSFPELCGTARSCHPDGAQ